MPEYLPQSIYAVAKQRANCRCLAFHYGSNRIGGEIGEVSQHDRSLLSFRKLRNCPPHDIELLLLRQVCARRLWLRLGGTTLSLSAGPFSFAGCSPPIRNAVDHTSDQVAARLLGPQEIGGLIEKANERFMQYVFSIRLARDPFPGNRQQMTLAALIYGAKIFAG